MKRISVRFAANAILALLIFVVVFHLLVLTGVIPYQIVWGGRLQTPSGMYVFESLSILLNVVIIAVVSMFAGYIKSIFSPKIYRFVFWLLTILFAFNTIGNLLTESTWEAYIFTPFTFFLSVLFFRLIRDKTN